MVQVERSVGFVRLSVCLDDNFRTKWHLTLIFGTLAHLGLYTSSSIVKVINQGSRSQEENVAKVVSVTLSDTQNFSSLVRRTFAFNCCDVPSFNIRFDFYWSIAEEGVAAILAIWAWSAIHEGIKIPVTLVKVHFFNRWLKLSRLLLDNEAVLFCSLMLHDSSVVLFSCGFVLS